MKDAYRNFELETMDLDLCCNRGKIRRQSRALANEQLDFLDGTALGDVDIFIESGETRRKVRRIIEKRVCQGLHRKGRPTTSNYSRYTGKHRVTNHLKNIYGKVPTGFLYAA